MIIQETAHSVANEARLRTLMAWQIIVGDYRQAERHHMDYTQTCISRVAAQETVQRNLANSVLVVRFAVKHDPRLVARFLLQESRLFTAPNYLQRQRKPVRPAELLDYTHQQIHVASRSKPADKQNPSLVSSFLVRPNRKMVRQGVVRHSQFAIGKPVVNE